jgi:hypothetical protein
MRRDTTNSSKIRETAPQGAPTNRVGRSSLPQAFHHVLDVSLERVVHVLISLITQQLGIGLVSVMAVRGMLHVLP